MINKLCIIGVGLIGGSLSRALRKQGYCKHVTGCSRDASHLQRAVELGVIDDYDTDITKAVQGADMIVVAVPLGAMQAVFTAMRPALAEHVVITDVGSSKASVVEAAKAGLVERYQDFVPGHPIAGTEKSGVEASFSELFLQRKVILTPIAETRPEAVEAVRTMWQTAGAEVVALEVSHHDDVLAATSHLPHVLAFTLVESMAQMGDRDEIFQYAAGGFRDFTRIASSDPVMWADICLANHDALLAAVTGFQADLDKLHSAIERGDRQALMDLFTRAKQARDRYAEGQTEQ
ncbi:MAG TPA: prephenate dehydrogenase/arogenate dehydrogenase family protein [Gammaproteobacteria bacterium]|nr:prephenate dehydrogenase/arogenate dehydrogenase family protein [Gammaproteobacteria bacterium]